MFQRIYLLGLLLCMLQFASAQSPFPEGLSIGVNSFYGKLFKHRSTMVFELPKPVTGFSIEVQKQSLGKEYWHKVHGYPRFGFALVYKRFGNPSVLGNAYGFIPQLDLDIISHKKFSWYVRLSMGLCYVSRPFDRMENTGNNAIGSYLNNLTVISTFAEQQVGDHLLLRLGGTLMHTSNGKMQLPNLGLNTATVFAGMAYILKPVETHFEYDYEAVPLDKRIRPNVRLGIGMRETKASNGPKTPLFILSASATKMLSRKSKWFLGFEGFFDRGRYEFLVNQELEDDDNISPTQDPMRFTVFGAHEFMFGRFGIYSEVFFYLDHAFQGKDFWGIKLGPNVYFLKPQEHRFQPYGGVYLRAHKTVADNVEFAMGLRF